MSRNGSIASLKSFHFFVLTSHGNLIEGIAGDGQTGRYFASIPLWACGEYWCENAAKAFETDGPLRERHGDPL
jgi:hypothetical protein